jgi:hypothetical protein
MLAAANDNAPAPLARPRGPGAEARRLRSPRPRLQGPTRSARGSLSRGGGTLGAG